MLGWTGNALVFPDQLSRFMRVQSTNVNSGRAFNTILLITELELGACSSVSISVNAYRFAIIILFISEERKSSHVWWLHKLSGMDAKKARLTDFRHLATTWEKYVNTFITELNPPANGTQHHLTFRYQAYLASGLVLNLKLLLGRSSFLCFIRVARVRLKYSQGLSVADKSLLIISRI